MSGIVKNVATLVMVIAAMFLFWWLISDVQQSTRADSGSVDASFQTREFRTILNDLNEINLSSNLLIDSNFTGMQDYTQPIINRPIGRENPFEITSNRSALPTEIAPAQ